MARMTNRYRVTLVVVKKLSLNAYDYETFLRLSGPFLLLPCSPVD